MSFQENRQRGNRAVALLASCFVVLGGGASCTVIALSADLDRPEAALFPIAGVMAGTLLLLWLVREEPAVNRLKIGWGWLSRVRKRRVPYRVRARVPAHERVSSPPAPPTVESIRQITGRLDTARPATWVSVNAENQPPSSVDPTNAGLK
jgi:hypothetical protein